MAPKVVLVDYGIGNLLSVQRGFEYWGINVETTDNPKTILTADRVVLPGVGSFRLGMSELVKRGLVDAIRDTAKSGVPLLAICLGMQLLFDYGEEHGPTNGLGIIPGRVSEILPLTSANKKLRVPHIGWNSIYRPSNNSNWEDTLLEGLKPQSEVYFNHSFIAIPDDLGDVEAVCDYGGYLVTSVVRNGATTGCQFHPEKSGEIGLKILKNFINQ